ncbi:hypothetical protein [Orientia tsutsugamushi]|uniref:hypothetical protein n=1 Tax=Orientia tsutsugamushi TaxID=784 RepID=UPI003529ADD5
MHNGISNISSSYVAMTRHIENLQLYCNKKATVSINSLINQLSRPNEKSASITLKTAHDLEKERTKTTVFSKVFSKKGAITSIVVPSEGEDFNEMLKNKGAVAVKELMIPEIMKLINTQNIKTDPEQILKTDITLKIGVMR